MTIYVVGPAYYRRDVLADKNLDLGQLRITGVFDDWTISISFACFHFVDRLQ
jgi:hypothetical protein